MEPERFIISACSMAAGSENTTYIYSSMQTGVTIQHLTILLTMIKI
jgi:hypothetical protein